MIEFNKQRIKLDNKLRDYDKQLLKKSDKAMELFSEILNLQIQRRLHQNLLENIKNNGRESLKNLLNSKNYTFLLSEEDKQSIIAETKKNYGHIYDFSRSFNLDAYAVGYNLKSIESLVKTKNFAKEMQEIVKTVAATESEINAIKSEFDLEMTNIISLEKEKAKLVSLIDNLETANNKVVQKEAIATVAKGVNDFKSEQSLNLINEILRLEIQIKQQQQINNILKHAKKHGKKELNNLSLYQLSETDKEAIRARIQENHRHNYDFSRIKFNLDSASQDLIDLKPIDAILASKNYKPLLDKTIQDLNKTIKSNESALNKIKSKFDLEMANINSLATKIPHLLRGNVLKVQNSQELIEEISHFQSTRSHSWFLFPSEPKDKALNNLIKSIQDQLQKGEKELSLESIISNWLNKYDNVIQRTRNMFKQNAKHQETATEKFIKDFREKYGHLVLSPSPNNTLQQKRTT